jgi:hypothetical protein
MWCLDLYSFAAAWSLVLSAAGMVRDHWWLKLDFDLYPYPNIFEYADYHIVLYPYHIIFIFTHIHIQWEGPRPYHIHMYLNIFKICFFVSYFWPALRRTHRWQIQPTKRSFGRGL